jgi:PncC family amidohydrolase
MLETDVLDKLGRAGLTLAVAESCTGGRICDRITDVPGSSEHFRGGIVAYSNDSKVRFLGVSHETLKAHGAVSEECAREMASGVSKAFGADLGVSVTGIAGRRREASKPVGWFSSASPGEECISSAIFRGNREAVKMQSAEQALVLLLNFVP